LNVTEPLDAIFNYFGMSIYVIFLYMIEHYIVTYWPQMGMNYIYSDATFQHLVLYEYIEADLF